MTQHTLDFAPDVDAASRSLATTLLTQWNVLPTGASARISRLSGGASNVNLRVQTESADWALRLCDPLAERWGVDRAAAIQAQSDAAVLGLAPTIVAQNLPDGHFLSQFIEGVTVTSEYVREADLLAPIGHTLRTLNEGTTAGRVFSPFDDLGTFVEFGDGDGVGFAQQITEELAAVKRIQSLFETRDAPRGFCHSDLVPQNFIQTGDGLVLVDFDYAGTGWIAFELASFCCQAQLDADETHALLVAYDPSYDAGQAARVELMRAIAGIREAAWAHMAEPILSGSTAPLDGWTYQGYAANNLAQARGVLADGRLEEYLKAAREVREGARF